MTTKLPEKIDRLPYDIARLYSTPVLGEYYKRDITINNIIDVLNELTSRIDTIEGNQLEMKRGKRCPEEDFGFEPKDQPKRCLQHFLQIDPTDGYQIVSYGFETREAAEAYKAKLLADNQQ